MRGRSARFLMRALGLLVLVSLILAMVGCGGDGGGGGDKDAIAIMEKLPKTTETFMFVDIKTMRTDDDLKDMYDSFSEDTGTATMMGGVDMKDVSFFAMSDELMIVMEGSFDLAEMRQALEADGWEKDDYEGVEIWQSYGYSLVLVDSGCIIMASDTDAEDCIDVIKGKADSLYEAADVADDMGKLPGDSLVVMWVGGSEGFITDEGYAGLEATAISMSKKDTDELQATAIMRFRDASSAGNVKDEVKTDMEESADTEVSNVKVTQDGMYIKATADMQMDEEMFS